jgi:hypothetical protein
MNSAETVAFGDEIRARPRTLGALTGWLTFVYSSRACLTRLLPPHTVLQALLVANGEFWWAPSCNREMLELARFSGVSFHEVEFLFSSATHGLLQMSFCARDRAPSLEGSDSQYAPTECKATIGDEISVGGSEFLKIIDDECAALDEVGTRCAPLELSSESSQSVVESVGSCDS